MKSILGQAISASFIWQGGVCLFISFLIFNPPLSHPQSLAIALGGGLLISLFSRFDSDQIPSLGIWAWVFLGYSLFSVFWSCQPGISLVTAGILFLSVLLFLSQAGWGAKVQTNVEWVGMLLAGIAAGMALEQRFIGIPSLSRILPNLSGQELEMVRAAIHNQRAFGPLVTSGALAALFIFFIPQAFIRCLISTGFKKYFLGGGVVLLLAGLWATQSVGALSSLAVAVLVILAMRRSYRTLVLVLLLGGGGVLYLIAQRGLASWHLAAYSMRLELWEKAMTLFWMKPWLGWGLGCFGEAYQNMGFDPNTGSRFAHDLPLQVLVELGIPGLVLLFLAVVSIIRRVKVQGRWEAWGVGTGFFSVLFFSFVDLPFQMPELALLFAAIAGRIELRRSERKEINISRIWQTNRFGLAPVEWILLAVFLFTGFWPPFRPWNFALLAVTLWGFAGLGGKVPERVPLWTLLGVLFFVMRALTSPSASGCVRFFEISGILLAFTVLLARLPNKDNFIKGFGFLGLFWAVKVWWETFHYSDGSLLGWVHFQFSDVKDWIIFPNPKQIGLFLIPLLFLPFIPRNLKSSRSSGMRWVAACGALLTMARLKSGGALLGFGVGLSGLVKKRYLPWVLGFAVLFLVVLLSIRSVDPSPTKWGRLEIWGSAAKVFLMRPLWGEGPGAFAGLYQLVKEPREGGVSRFLMDARYAHNELLEALAAFGLVGFIFLAAWLIRLWPWKDHGWSKASVLGLGAASLTDFCLHTPLIALWGMSFLDTKDPESDEKKTPRIPPLNSGFKLFKGFLVLGIALGLFATPSFIPALTAQFERDVQGNQLPQALRCIETAEKLNPWDGSLTQSKASFLENLFLTTGDETWKERADQTWDRILELEASDGSLKFEKAESLTRRAAFLPSGENVTAAQRAWDEADQALPFDAFVKFEEATFYYRGVQEKGGIWDLRGLDNGTRAFTCFRQAANLEPNFAQAWYFMGLCHRGMGDDRACRDDWAKSFAAYDHFKAARRIDPLEQLLVSLSPEQLKNLRVELGNK